MPQTTKYRYSKEASREILVQDILGGEHWPGSGLHAVVDAPGAGVVAPHAPGAGMGHGDPRLRGTGAGGRPPLRGGKNINYRDHRSN